MEGRMIEDLKHSAEAIKENLNVLKKSAVEIIDIIDAGDLISEDIANELTQNLTNYQKQQQRLNNIGDELSINLGIKLNDIYLAIQAYEENYNLNAMRETVLDYFRLNSEDTDTKNELELSKLVLKERCALPTDQLEKNIVPYEMVVSAVRDGIFPLPEDKFKHIMESITFKIAFATDRGKLFIDNSIDASKHVDGSLPFSRFVVLEETSGRHITDVVAKSTKDSDEIKDKPFIAGSDISKEPEKTLRWEEYGGYISESVLVKITDINEKPTLKEIKKIEKQNHDTIIALWNAACEKLIRADNSVDSSSHIYSPTAIKQLCESGLLVNILIADSPKDKNFLTLSSKGWGCFAKSEIRNFFAKQNIPLMVPNKLCISCKAWTPLFAVRSALIHDYCNNIGQNYVMWKSDISEMALAKPVEHPNVTILTGLFREYNEETDIKEITKVLDSLGNNTIALFIVRKYEDITVLASELVDSVSHEGVEVLFVVVDKDYAVYDSAGTPRQLPKNTIKRDITIDNTLPEASGSERKVIEDAEPMVLTALNSIKTNVANASKFKKHILELSRQYKEIYTILSLLTNLGVLERDQIFSFGVCFDCFDENEKSSEHVYGAIDLLCSKGLLAKYQYLHNRKIIDVYGMADYCFKSMKKKEIDSARIWPLSLGKRDISCGRTIELGRVESIVNANAALLRYIKASKIQYDESEYESIKRSIKWADGYYTVDCYWKSEKLSCCIFVENLDMQTVEKDNVILPQKYINDAFKYYEQFEKIFIVEEEKVYLFKDDDRNENKTILSNADDNIDEIHEVDSKPKNIDNTIIIENENIHTNEIRSKDKYVIVTDAEENLADVKTRQTNNETKTEITEEYIEPPFVMEPISAPSDKEFCERVRAILNYSAHTEHDLFSSVADALLLARTAAFIKGYTNCDKLSRQLQFATSVFFDDYSYLSNDLTDVFAEEGLDKQAITLAAYCFALLSPAETHDYSLYFQSKTYLDSFERYFPDYNNFKYFFSKLLSIHSLAPTGFTPAVVSLLGNDDESNKYINALRAEAEVYLNYSSPKVRMKALQIMYGICFGIGSDLYECMGIITENRIGDLDYIKTVLGEYCTVKNGTFILDDSKIENKLNTAWNDSKPKKAFKLEFDARMHAFRQFKIRLSLMLAWHEHFSVQTNKDDNLLKLKVLRDEILDCIVALTTEDRWRSGNYSNIISYMMHRIKMMLSGQLNDMELFSGLLYTGIIPVDTKGLPILNEAHTDVCFNEPWRNAVRHIEAKKKVAVDIKEEILGINGDESGLLDNLNQLKMLGLWLGSEDEDFEVSEQQFKDAKEAAKLKTEKFLETLELAYTYNQINEIEKETLVSIVNKTENDFFEIGDFACWRRFLEGLEYQIKEYARNRQVGLRRELNLRKDKAPGSTLLAAASRLLEKDRNFAVTEEYINRFDNGETELTEELEAILNEIDYFSIFISPKVFNPLYELCKNRSGTALKNFGWSYLEKRLPKEWTARQRKDSEGLVSSWPVRKNATTSFSIQTLFTYLGFDVKNVTKVNDQKVEIFKTRVVPTNRSKADYLHPIAAFGTQMKSPINVIVLYGNYTGKQLVDTVSSLDLGGICIVLIDRPIDIANRRQIGEIFHTQTSGQNPFLLIDQVLFLYLAMHQITERLPALLKCTLPYSSYQPFVQDSGSTADEMFCGRTRELARIIDPNGACIVFGGRQLGKTALLQRAENRCMNHENKNYAVYVSILKLDTEPKVVEALSSAICKKTNNVIVITSCDTIRALCDQLEQYFISGAIARMHLLIDEVDDFLAAIAPERYMPIQPFVDLRRETTNNFKFVIAGLHNVCRAKNATTENGIFGQLGTPLCIKPLSPTDALQLLSRPLRYLGFRIDRYPHLETILTNTNYYPGILQFFGYMLVETLNNQYSKYYRAANGNPPFTLQDDQLGSVMNSADLNRSIKDKFRWSLELDKRYFMIARCITMMYHYYEDDRHHGSWLGFSVDQIIEMAKDYNIHCLEKESYNDYIVLLDEMVDMGILSRPGDKQLYRLRKSSFVDIIGESFDILDADIISNNEVV